MSTSGLAETIDKLKIEGYCADFNLKSVHIGDAEFVIDQTFRFDVETDPDDQSVLYAIHSLRTGKRGILVNSFGIYSEPIANLKIQALTRE